MTALWTPTAYREPTAADMATYRPVGVPKTSDQTVNNSTTLVNDAELLVPVDADATYHLDLTMVYNSGVTPGLKWAWSYPTGLVILRGAGFGYFGGSWSGNTFTDQTVVTTLAGFAGELYYRLAAIVVVASTAGTLQLRWAQATANASNSVVRAGSYLRLTQIA